jgi:hypothetical protein
MKLVKKSAACSTEQKSRAARRSRNKGAEFERKIAKLLEKAWGIKLSRTPQSGGFRKDAEGFRGDIAPADRGVELMFHLELKNQKAWSLPQWLRQAEADCPQGKIPVVIFHRHDSSEDYACLPLSGFLALARKGVEGE